MGIEGERKFWAAVLLAALGLYIAAHAGVLLARPAGELLLLSIPLVPPRGGLAPWLILAGATVGGVFFAKLAAGAAPRAVAWGIGCYASLVVPAHILGLLGWLWKRPLFRPDLWAGAVWLGAAWLAFWARRHQRTPAQPDQRPAVRNWRASFQSLGATTVVVALLAAGLYAHAVGRTIRHGPRAWDGESYHLPVPLQWIHTESLTAPLSRLVPVSPDEIDRFSNPGNGHLLMTVPLLLGWELPACLIQLPFTLLAGWAVWALARAGGASAMAASLAGLGFLSAPIVVEQATVPMLDLATAALTLTGVALLVRNADADQPPLGCLRLAGLAFGLALGTKTTAFSQLVFPLVVIAGSRWAHRPRAWRGMASVLLLLLVPTAFWYGRSAVFFGNPVHPIGLRVFGRTILGGMTADDMSGKWDLERAGMQSRADWVLFPFRDPEYSDETGFGALLVSLVAIALLKTAVDVSRALRERQLTGERRIAILVGSGLLVFWFVAARTPRFNLPFFALLAAGAGPAIDVIGTERGRRFLSALVVVAAGVTLVLSLDYHGWDIGPPFDRAARLATDYPGVPVGLDALAPLVIFNDTKADWSSCPSNYALFGADYRHLVYDHPELPPDDAAEYMKRLRDLGATAVFLRLRKDIPEPARYRTADLIPLLAFNGKSYRSTLYRVR